MALSIDRWEKPGEPAEKVALEKELKARGYRPEFWVDKPGTIYRNRRHETNTLLWILRGEARITIGTRTGVETDILHEVTGSPSYPTPPTPSRFWETKSCSG